jgi:hypothetical protein
MRNILHHWWGKVLAGVFAFLLVFTVIGFFVIPIFIKSMLTKNLSANLGREVQVQRVRFNPYTISLRVSNLVIKDKDTSVFASLDELFLNVQFSSIFKRVLIIKGLHVKQPSVQIVRFGNTDFNFSDLMTRKDADSVPVQFSFHEIKIIDGKINFRDEVEKTRHKLDDINITIPFLSNLPQDTDREIILACSALLDGAPISISGKGRPFAEFQQAILHADVRELNIPQYSPYLPLNTNVNILSGYMDFKTTLSYSRNNGSISSPALLFLQTFLSLNSIALKHGKEKEEFLILPKLSVHNTTVDIPARKITVEEIFTEKGSLVFRRFTDGTFNFQDLIPPIEEPEHPKQAWLININDFLVREFTIQGKDMMVPDPVHVTLDQVNLQASGLTTERGEKGQVSLSLRWNQNGTATAEANIGFNPISAHGKMSIDAVDISPLHRYFTDTINLLITKADFHAQGDFVFDHTEEDGPIVSYRGDASLSDLMSIEKLYEHDFLGWKTLSLSDITIGYNPTEISVAEMFLDNFSLYLFIHPDGTSNFRAILAQEVEDAGELPEQQEVDIPEIRKGLIPPLKIDVIDLQNGHIHLVDRFIPSGFESRLKNITATIAGLSSGETEPADISLRGEIEGVHPLEITGKIDLLTEAKYADLNFVLSGFDLPPLTPYAGRYLGHMIEKGKLYLNLEYKVSRDKLYGENRITLDQFTLGERIESPVAVALPMKFIVSTLKDRKGKIELGFPVRGDLNDPRFKLRSVIVNSMIGLATRAATSPLAFLGDIFAAGEELSFLEFDYGSSRLDEEEIHILENLIVALYERPLLKLEILGGADQEKDREALKLRQFIELIKAQKLKDMIEEGIPAVPLHEVSVHYDEYEKYLKRAYEDADLTKPENIYESTSDIPIQEMERLLMDHIKITDDDLRSLANTRASQTRDYILESRKVEPERIFILEPKIHPPEDNEEIKKSRVQFTLR